MAINKNYFGIIRYLRSRILSRSIKLLLQDLAKAYINVQIREFMWSKKDANSMLVYEEDFETYIQWGRRNSFISCMTKQI